MVLASFLVASMTGALTWNVVGLIQEVKKLQSKITTIEKILSPLSEEVNDNGLQFNVRSIPKLLSAIETEGGTLLEYVTFKSQNSSDVSLNLIKAHDNIVNSLKNLKI